jgi:hypothetical protein
MAHLRSRLTCYACSGARTTAAGAAPPIVSECFVQTSGPFTSQERTSRACCSADRDRSPRHALTSFLIGLRSCHPLVGTGLNSKMCGQAFRDGRDRLVVRDLRTWLLFGAPAFRLSTNAGHQFRFNLINRVDRISWFCSGLATAQESGFDTDCSGGKEISRAGRQRLFLSVNRDTNATDFDNGASRTRTSDFCISDHADFGDGSSRLEQLLEPNYFGRFRKKIARSVYPKPRAAQV